MMKKKRTKLTTINTTVPTPAPPALARVIPIGTLIFVEVRAERVNGIITIYTMTAAAAASAAGFASSRNPFAGITPIET